MILFGKAFKRCVFFIDLFQGEEAHIKYLDLLFLLYLDIIGT